jgi:hypothetical protein
MHQKQVFNHQHQLERMQGSSVQGMTRIVIEE